MTSVQGVINKLSGQRVWLLERLSRATTGRGRGRKFHALRAYDRDCVDNI